jgi:hypothetical protein
VLYIISDTQPIILLLTMSNDKKEINILVWFEVFNSLIAQDYENRSDRVLDMFDDADIIYADKNSYRSACEFVASSKIHKMPDYINNDEAVKAYAKEREVEYDKINVIAPIDVLAIIVDKNPEELEETFDEISNGMVSGLSDNSHKPKGINISEMSEEEMRENLPGPIADAFHGLTKAIEETSSRAEEIISEYMSACDISGIDESQAKEEGQSYMSSDGGIPAAEFICPVNILDRLKQI